MTAQDRPPRADGAPDAGGPTRSDATREAAAPTQDSPSLLVIWNPRAGTKAGLPITRIGEEELRRALEALGLAYELVVSDEAATTASLVEGAVLAGRPIVVAAGGDGTAGVVARGLIGTSTALAILPLGSAMNLARSLGIPRDLEAAMRVVAGGRVRVIDVGSAGERVFFEIGSVGLNAALFAQAQRIARGEYSSLLGLLRVMLRFRPARVLLRLDGRSVRMHALMVAVANTPYTGLGMTLAPRAIVDDGLFDVTVFRGFSRWELVRHLGGIVAGRRRYSPKVATFRARHVEIDARRSLPVRVDADDLGTTPVTFDVHPRALRVIVPEGSSRPGAVVTPGPPGRPPPLD